jgi:hypothetical protein
MGSLNSSGIPIVTKQNITLRNEGGALVITSGLPPQGAMGVKVSTQQEVEGHNRSLAEFGTQVNEEVTQYSTVCIAPAKKTTSSDDATLNEALIARNLGKIAPDSGNQPEIANKPVSQRSAYHTGGRVVVRNSDDNSLVGRNANTGFIPGGES